MTSSRCSRFSCKHGESRIFFSRPQICKRCRRPFDSPDFFKLDPNRCDSCQRRYIKEREKRETKKREREGLSLADDEKNIVPAKKKPVFASMLRETTAGSTSKCSNKSRKATATSTDTSDKSNANAVPFRGMKKKYIAFPVFIVDD